MNPDDMSHAQYVHRFDQLGAQALGNWDAEVDTSVAAIRSNALPAGRPEAFVAVVAQLQDWCAGLSTERTVTGMTYLAATALLRLAELQEAQQRGPEG